MIAYRLWIKLNLIIDILEIVHFAISYTQDAISRLWWSGPWLTWYTQTNRSPISSLRWLQGARYRAWIWYGVGFLWENVRRFADTDRQLWLFRRGLWDGISIASCSRLIIKWLIELMWIRKRRRLYWLIIRIRQRLFWRVLWALLYWRGRRSIVLTKFISKRTRITIAQRLGRRLGERRFWRWFWWTPAHGGITERRSKRVAFE